MCTPDTSCLSIDIADHRQVLWLYSSFCPHAMGNELCAHPTTEVSWVHQTFFPMYLVKVSDLLQMSGRPRSHGFLLQENLLHVWKPGMSVDLHNPKP